MGDASARADRAGRTAAVGAYRKATTGLVSCTLSFEEDEDQRVNQRAPAHFRVGECALIRCPPAPPNTSWDRPFSWSPLRCPHCTEPDWHPCAAHRRSARCVFFASSPVARAQHIHLHWEWANVLRCPYFFVLKFLCWPRLCRDCGITACHNFVFSAGLTASLNLFFLPQLEGIDCTFPPEITTCAKGRSKRPLWPISGLRFLRVGACARRRTVVITCVSWD